MSFLWSHPELLRLAEEASKEFYDVPSVVRIDIIDISLHLRTDEKIRSLQFREEETEVHKGNLVVFLRIIFVIVM